MVKRTWGGVKTLKTLNLQPVVYHMNEGHSAFLALERICRLEDEHGLSFHEAKELVTETNVFTIHTSVPAGYEEFDVPLIKKYLPDYFVLPHPSPRNNIWQAKNEWFKVKIIPELQLRINNLIK